jgi:hypothetical protein
MRQASIYDDSGLLYVLVEILPNQQDGVSDGEDSYDEEDSYADDSYQVEQRQPEPLGFGFSRIPVTGELLQVRENRWVVRQVIHHNLSPEKVEESLKKHGEVFVATIQVEYYGVA